MDRFWAKVDRTSGRGPSGDCWIWTACKLRSGYGKYFVGTKDGVKHFDLAHRFAWQTANGPIQAGAFVCHTCDTPSCVNPAHLFVGNHSDNMRDMREKSRAAKRSPQQRAINSRKAYALHSEKWRRGSRHSQSRLSEADVLEIRRAYAEDGLSQQAIANMFGVSQVSVSVIVRGAGWKHV